MKKKTYRICVAICILLLMGSLYQVIKYYSEAYKAKEEFAKLTEFTGYGDGQGRTDDLGKEDQKEESLLTKYQELSRQNPDMAGWIFIEGTGINYPVMYTPEKPDYYLNHNFEKQYSVYGVPYIAEHSDPKKPGDNVIVYGHHMDNGTMFAGLMDYTVKDFYEKHKVIHFDTLTETGEYEILAVFKTPVYGEKGFKYYQFTDAEKPEDFKEYVDKCKAISLYNTGVDAVYGDKLLTLSTCEYSVANGRMVVVAKKVKQEKAAV